MKHFILLAAFSSLAAFSLAQAQTEDSQGLATIKTFLVNRVTQMDGAAHDYVTNAAAYQQIIDSNGGDYNKAALASGPQLLSLVAKMQGDFRTYHNNGYETIEGITAGVKKLVDFDNYLDGGVPKGEASTDNPPSPLVLKAADGKIIIDHNGNLFHYVIEPTLWGTKKAYVRELKPEIAQKLHGITELPRAEVVTASAKDCAFKIDELLAASKAWNPTVEECMGALVWMTPTLNSYFDDWKDSRYNPNAAAEKYVAESRVVDMKGIMSSLQLVYEALSPDLEKKDPALAGRLRVEYQRIMTFVVDIEARETNTSGKKISIAEIEELALQAKKLTDQLTPQLKQAATLMNVKLPPKPILV